MTGYVNIIKVKDGDKDKNYKLIPFHIDGEKLLGKYKAFSTKIKDLKNIELNALPVYDDTYITNKIRTRGNKVYTVIGSLNVSLFHPHRKRIFYSHFYLLFTNIFYEYTYTIVIVKLQTSK